MRNPAEAAVVSSADGRQRYAAAIAAGSSRTCATPEASRTFQRRELAESARVG